MKLWDLNLASGNLQSLPGEASDRRMMGKTSLGRQLRRSCAETPRAYLGVGRFGDEASTIESYHAADVGFAIAGLVIFDWENAEIL